MTESVVTGVLPLVSS